MWYLLQNKMRKPKIACFHYKKHNDIYVNNVNVSTRELMLILEFFQNQKMIVLMESDTDYSSTLLSTSKSVGIKEIVPCFQTSGFIMVCNKTELLYLFNQIDINAMEGLFIGTIEKDVVSDAFMHSLEYKAGSIVQLGISDIAVSINFSENQMVLSLSKEKNAVISIKNKIRSIFGE